MTELTAESGVVGCRSPSNSKIADPKTFFHHPYDPYPIQVEFMTKLYETLNLAKIGIFESPTGTGKTLSLLCACLAWLRTSHNDLKHEEEINLGDDEPSWVLEQDRELKRGSQSDDVRDLEHRLAGIRKHVEERKSQRAQATSSLLSRKHAKKSKPSGLEIGTTVDEEFLVNDVDLVTDSMSGSAANSEIFSTEVLELLRYSGHTSVLERSVLDSHMPIVRKIFFASRTHSQLSQVSSELVKLKVSSAEPRAVALASRRSLCINPVVNTLDPETLTETCLDMQDSKRSGLRRCEYLSDDIKLRNDFSDHALASIHDIEDLVQLGRKMHICPYYASHLAIPSAEIVTLPYQLLLNKSARLSLGLCLEGNVVVIDEAHNLVDAIKNTFDTSVTEQQLNQAKQILTVYITKFESRLRGSNRVYIEQVVKMICGLHDLVSSGMPDQEVEISQLLGHGLDAVNLHTLTNYLRSSKLARKAEKYAQSLEDKTDKPIKSGPVLTNVQNFLECLAYPAAEGRFFIETMETGGRSLRYMLLDPAYVFSDIVREAHSVILAGGTMSPVADLKNLLFPGSTNDIREFTCGHIIPKNNLRVMVAKTGLGKCEFNFTFDKRYDDSLLRDLGNSISNLLSVIPDGVVLFFPSYSYLEYVYQAWKDSGTLALLNRKKPLFAESRAESSDNVLREYTLSVDSRKGGLLFAIVGGKMSEGINFSDSLGRGIVMVGLPFPNRHTVEWQTKLKYIEQTSQARLQAEGVLEQDAYAKARQIAQDHYQSTAMRAINQSIGRAIRHKSDFAVIVLLDIRYSLDYIQMLLPAWIRAGMNEQSLSFPAIIRQTALFFRGRRDH